MNNVLTALKLLFSLLLVWMCYTAISTSLQSNPFKQWDSLVSIPWMRATLWDFYANLAVIFLWVCYKVNNVGFRLLWLILLIAFGSIASCVFVLIQLYKLKPGEGLKEFFGKTNG